MENIQNQNSMTTEAPEVNTSASTEATTTPAPEAISTTAATASTTPAPEAISTTAAVSTTSATPEASASTAASDTTPAPIRKMLPPGYLSTGGILDAEGIIIPEYIGRYAEELARLLAPMKASTFSLSFLTKAKGVNKKKVPYCAQKNCAMGMVTEAKKLVSRKKDPAPAVLLQMITAATNTVKDAETFHALYMHLDAIYSYMLQG